MWYESVKMCVRPSVRPKEWMEKRTRLIDRVWKCVSTSVIYWRAFYLIGILDTVSVRPSVHAKAKWIRTGIWKCDAFCWLSLISSTQKGENLFWGKKSKVLTHLKVSEKQNNFKWFLEKTRVFRKAWVIRENLRQQVFNMPSKWSFQNLAIWRNFGEVLILPAII